MRKGTGKDVIGVDNISLRTLSFFQGIRKVRMGGTQFAKSVGGFGDL